MSRSHISMAGSIDPTAIKFPAKTQISKEVVRHKLLPENQPSCTTF